MANLNLDTLRHAVQALEDSLKLVGDSAWLAQQSATLQHTLIAGIVKHFEFVYELSTKMLKRQMEAEAANPVDIDTASFRDLLRMAAEKGIITDVQVWFEYREMRNITAHTYDQTKAQVVHDGAQRFLADARALLSALEKRNA